MRRSSHRGGGPSPLARRGRPVRHHVGVSHRPLALDALAAQLLGEDAHLRFVKEAKLDVALFRVGEHERIRRVGSWVEVCLAAPKAAGQNCLARWGKA